ncbi:MAG TPA: hypothetical protein VLA09_08835, partial [Longimicrobiales bacterium]|nr:hypothetical protein [Longimicrobiales bacterium]
GVPVSATAVRRSVPTNVDAAIRKALEKLPADRFTGAQAFAKALADTTFRHGGGPVVEAAASPRSWKALSGALAVALVAVGAWAVRPAPEAPLPVYRFEAPFREGQEPLAADLVLAISPDGSMIVYRGPTEAATAGGQLWVRRWDDLEATPLRGTEGADAASFSPDGSELAFRQGPELKVLPLQGGPIRTLGSPGQLTAWGADDFIYTGGQDRPMRTAPSGGSGEELFPEGSTEYRAVTSVLPGGEHALVFSGTSAQDARISVLTLATGELEPLAPGLYPRYTATGHVIYTTSEGLLMAVPFDLDGLDFAGDPVAILEGVGQLFHVSANGTLVYSTSPGGAGGAAQVEPVWLTRTGEIASVDAGWTFDRGGDANFGFRLSPDGTRLAVRAFAAGNYDIWIKLLEPGGPFSRLTRADGEERMPRWSPDGRHVTFLSGRGGSMDVWQRPADGTGEAEMLYEAEPELAQGFWGPDGAWLILRTTTGTGVGGRDILAVRPGVDSAPLRLLAEDYDEASPAISPDGRWLAYGSNETGAFEVFVRPFPDVDAGKVQVSNAGGTSPLWSPDGTELFFHDAQAQVVSVHFESEPAFRVTERTPLFTVPEGFVGRGGANTFITGQYDVGPDGRFLMMRPAGDAPIVGEGERARVIVVLNWFEELRARVPN